MQPSAQLSAAGPAPGSPWTPFEASHRVALSIDRLRRFRKERDKQAWAPAIGRYHYNVEMTSALYPALNWAEVVLRNHLNTIIGQAYPVGSGRSFNRVASWLDAAPAILLPLEQEKVTKAIGDLERRNRQRREPSGAKAPIKVLTDGRLVAELRFGFWTRLLDGVYADWRNPANPRFWPGLLDRAFPHCPGSIRTRKDIHSRFTQIKELRNRAFHHERISHQVTIESYDEVLEAIHWIDPMLAAGLRERERPGFKAVLDSGPQPFIEWAMSKVTL
jgi:hypothetical protein